MRAIILALVAVLASLLPVSVYADTRVDPSGFGQIRVGMTPAQAATASGKPLHKSTEQVGTEKCYFISSANGPEGLQIMVENSSVVRVDIKRPGIRTDAGAQIGTTEAELKRLYGSKLAWMPHQYVQQGHYAEFSPDKKYYMIYETDGRKVTLIRAGRLPAVRYVEGCL